MSTGLEYRRRRALPVFLSLVAGMTWFAALAFWKAFPVIGDYHSVRQLCRVMVPRLSPKSCWYCTAIFTTPRYYTDYQTTQESVPSPEVLRLYIREHQQNRHYLLTQESGWRELEESLQLRLLRHRGTLYLVKITWENQEPPSSF